MHSLVPAGTTLPRNPGGVKRTREGRGHQPPHVHFASNPNHQAGQTGQNKIRFVSTKIGIKEPQPHMDDGSNNYLRRAKPPAR
jgi:hypothetical protein